MDDVIRDVVNPLVTELRISEARDGVVFVEAVLCLGRRLYMPFDEGSRDRVRDLYREHGLPGSGLTLHQ